MTSDVAFLARADADVRARLLIQATNGLQALHRASKGLGHLAHVAALLDRLGVLLQPGTTLGSATSRSGMESPLAVQLARSYILSKVCGMSTMQHSFLSLANVRVVSCGIGLEQKEKGSAEHLKEGLKRRANLASAVLRLRSLAAANVRNKKSLPAQALNELIPSLGAVKVP